MKALDCPHDTMYSAVYMAESLYREVLKRALADLASAISKRNQLLQLFEATEKEIAQLKRLIGGIHAYVDESEANEELAGWRLKRGRLHCTARRKPRCHDFRNSCHSKGAAVSR